MTGKEEKVVIAITGARGFIGSYVLRELSQSEHVIVASPQLDLLKASDTEIQRVFGNADVVIHLAAIFPISRSEDSPTHYEKNVEMARRLLFNTRAKVVFASSTEVYGEKDKVEITESEKPDPMTYYGKAKLKCEEMVLNHNEYNVCLRLSGVYGKGDRSRKVIPLFSQVALGKGVLFINGDGTQLRNFVHVEDVARAFRIFAEKSVLGGVYNIGGLGCNSVIEVAETIFHVLGKKPVLNFNIDICEKDIGVSSFKAFKQTGYFPRISLLQGIMKTLK